MRADIEKALERPEARRALNAAQKRGFEVVDIGGGDVALVHAQVAIIVSRWRTLKGSVVPPLSMEDKVQVALGPDFVYRLMYPTFREFLRRFH